MDFILKLYIFSLPLSNSDIKYLVFNVGELLDF